MRNSGRSTSRPAMKMAHGHRLANGEGEIAPHAAGAGNAEHADDEQQRHDREVLQQQDREAGTADRRAELPALDQELHDDCRGGERETGAEDYRRLRRSAERPDDRGDGRAGDADLQAAEAEDEVAHAPQAVERQFEPDREQEEDHAELGETPHAVDVGYHGEREPAHLVLEQAESEGADDPADDQVAEDGAHSETMEKRHDDPGRDQEDHELAKIRDALCLLHVAVLWG
jgi:hypothetical protein